MKGQYQAAGSILVVVRGKMQAIFAFEVPNSHGHDLCLSRNCRKRATTAATYLRAGVCRRRRH
jgi:hypothetical protein